MTVDAWNLVGRTQLGEPEAFGELYDLYIEDVYGFIHGEVRSHPTAEGLTADVFFMALRSIKHLQRDWDTPQAWLMTIARDVVTHHLAPRRGPRSAPRPRRGLERDHETGMLRGLIHKLSGDQRRCLELRYLDGLDVFETARRMGRSAKAVELLHFHAIRRLHKLMGLDES